MNHPIQTVVLSSLHKVLPEIDPSGEAKTSFSCMKNEPLSFQVAYKLKEGCTAPFNLKIITDLPITIYSEGAVPVSQAEEPSIENGYRSGVFYDMLLQKSVNPKLQQSSYPWKNFYFDGDGVQLYAVFSSWKALWLTVNEEQKNIPDGIHTIKLQLLSRNDNQLIGECELTVEVINARLPKQKLIYTNWFHCDCLCDTYGVEMFSERFWEIFRNYVTVAAKNGMNMILTPCFTPPLDTPVGSERMTAQLVDVQVIDSEYHFDFALLERFIDEAQKCGIRYFEHSHFFTQWGALHAPKIMATVDGKYKQIFGWNTKACGKKYRDFLRAYIPQLLEFLRKKKLDKNILFHISDEPCEGIKEAYMKAKAGIEDLLEGCMYGDALFHYNVYKDIKVHTPIVCTENIHEFHGKCKNLWAYYSGMNNQKINSTPESNRMMGLRFYSYNIKGFLYWAYNYYYDELSCGISDPKSEPCLFCGAYPGLSFFVYPSIDGRCIPSIRQKVFCEAINDMRALQLLESKIGRKATLEFVRKYFGNIDFHTQVCSAEQLLSFREDLNKEILYSN